MTFDLFDRAKTRDTKYQKINTIELASKPTKGDSILYNSKIWTVIELLITDSKTIVVIDSSVSSNDKTNWFVL